MFATRVPTPYPVPDVLTVVEGSTCVSENSLNVLSVDASKNKPAYFVVVDSTYLPKKPKSVAFPVFAAVKPVKF
jgi:hypothetical protein